MLAGGFALVAVCCFRKDARTEMPRHDNTSRWVGLAPTVAGTALLAILFPVLQTVCFGKTDYTRNAQVAVVFGARAYANGQPSDALADRVRTACDLYHQGRVQTLVMSGGPGDGAIHETEAMRRMAIAEGVNDQDIVLDSAGLNTLKTVDNTIKLFPELGARRILVVSHFYHLPRIKMAYHQKGWEVYTVPAKERYFLRQTPHSVAREVAAFWSYYLKSFRV
jgi:vancomycin permeability regulator SanA